GKGVGPQSYHYRAADVADSGALGKSGGRVTPTLRDGKARAAAARRHDIRILDLKGLPDQVVGIVDFGSAHEFEAERIDQDGRAVLGEHEIVRRRRLLHQVVLVLETRAAASRNGNAQHRPRPLLGEDA